MKETFYQTYNRIQSRIRSGSLDPVYLVLGNEYLFYRKFLENIQSAFNKKSNGQGEITQRWGTDLKTLADLNALIGGGSLFSSSILIILHEFQGASQTVKKNVASLMKNISEDMVVVIHYDGDQRKKKWLDTLKSVSLTVPLGSPRFGDMEKVVARLAEIKGKQIDKESIHRLAELSGGDLAIIDNEIEKIALFLDEDVKTIGPEIVEQLAGSVENAIAVQFLNALDTRDRKEAIRILSEVESKRQEGFPFLVAIVYNHLIQLMAAKESAADLRDVSYGALAPYILKKLESASNKFSLEELQRATMLLADIDLEFRMASRDLLSSFSGWVAKVF